MSMEKEVTIRICTQLIKYLLDRHAEKVVVEIKSDERYRVTVSASVTLDEEEEEKLRFYLSTRPQEIGYYYLTLVGEYGAEEELTVAAMLVDELSVGYDREKRRLEISFRVR